MKRNQELIALTRAHHTALVLARRAIVTPSDGAKAMALAVALPEIFARELGPYFLIEAHVRFEERELFPLTEAILPAHALAAVAASAVAKPRQHKLTNTGA